MMKRFATVSLIALMLGAVPAAFAQSGGGGSGGGSGGGTGGTTSPGGTTPSAPGSPGLGTQPPGSGAIQNNPSNPGTSGSSTDPLRPGTTQPQATGPVNNPSEATAALQSRGYNNVQGLVRTGEVFRGQANRDGRMVVVEIDARTGAVREIGS